jgi:hypothetical protein
VKLATLLCLFIFGLFTTKGHALEHLLCQDQSEASSSYLSLTPHPTYGVLGELRFEELRAHLICSQVTPSSMECLGHWKREGMVQDKIELYVTESDQVQKAQAFFSLPSDYGKKQVWFECITDLSLNRH